MFASTEYLRWAIRNYGTVEFDLATSGMTNVAVAELSPLPALDDTRAGPELRARIASHHGVPVNEVLPALGTTHALWCAYTALLSPGDELLLERPTYEPMYRIAEGVGARVRYFERPATERFALDPARVEAEITDRTRLVVVTNLHNPSGVRTPDAVLARVAEIAAKRGASLLVDEVYAPFDTMADGEGRWNGSARKLAPNVVVTSSLTKVYGLGNYRLGWMIAPPDVVIRGEEAVLSNLGHAPAAWSAVGVAAFDRLPQLATRARRLLEGKRAIVEAWVARQPHLTWSAPAEGLFGFALDGRGLDLRPAIERGIREQSVLAAPGSFFGLPNGVRISWSIAREKLEAGLERLSRVLASP
jgi:hypothetical protein